MEKLSNYFKGLNIEGGISLSCMSETEDPKTIEFIRKYYDQNYESYLSEKFDRLTLWSNSGKIIGYRSFSSLGSKDSKRLWLELSLVDPKFRRKGIATYLTLMAVKIMRDKCGFLPVDMVGTTKDGESFIEKMKPILNNKKEYCNLIKRIIK